MRLIGLLGGVSWESTAIYYRLMNREVATRLGGLHSARLLIHSFDFAELAELQRQGEWADIGVRLARTATQLEAAGAEAILLATNTLHHVAARIESAIRIPFLHIVDPTGDALKRAGVRRAGFLGTRYSMELPFWKERLATRYEIEMLTPDTSDRDVVHRIIYEELAVGRVDDASRVAYVEIINRLRSAGAEVVILGCTEIGMLIKQHDSALPVFDTAELHACAGIDFSLAPHESGRRCQLLL